MVQWAVVRDMTNLHEWFGSAAEADKMAGGRADALASQAIHRTLVHHMESRWIGETKQATGAAWEKVADMSLVRHVNETLQSQSHGNSCEGIARCLVQIDRERSG